MNQSSEVDKRIAIGGRIRGFLDILGEIKKLGISAEEAAALLKLLLPLLREFTWEGLFALIEAFAKAIETSPSPSAEEPGTLSISADRWGAILALIQLILKFLSENKS